MLLRPGGMPREAIEAIVGRLADPDADAPAAPGTLASHYAPRAEVIAVDPSEVPGRARSAAARADLVRASPPSSAFLSTWGELPAIAYRLPDDLPGIARALYAALRDLDAAGVDVVIAALPPAVGLGEAVGDRLRRAAGPGIPQGSFWRSPGPKGRVNKTDTREDSKKRSSTGVTPKVGIIMGSHSDWATMKAAADLLEELGIPYEKKIVSAHRTPDLLFEYAGSAVERGLQVIIAGAGGAAHLPGMTAARTRIAGARRAGVRDALERHRFAALDRPDAEGHPGRDGRDR